MNILLIDIDSKIENLALKKIEKYFLDRGDDVTWNFPLAKTEADKIYVSCIFSWNKDKCDEWEGIAEIGGTGHDIKKTLPPEIESIKPRMNLGFASRGCIRNCDFCFVPKKEGKIRAVGDVLDLWDGKAKNVIVLDNNILALPEHFALVCRQAREKKIRVDFNQGLDHRLINQDIVDLMKSISHVEYRFAFDHPSQINTVEKAINLLRKNNINRCSWYVLVGFNTTFEEDLFRLNYLRSLNQNAYVQRYNATKDPKYIPLARWANQRHIFNGMTWKQFIERKENKRYKVVLENSNV